MVKEKVKAIIAGSLDLKVENIRDEDSLKDDLGADSLDLVDIALACEEEFRIELPDDEAEKLLTVQQVTDYIKAKTNKT